MKEKIKKKKKRSLALQFGILFVIVAIVTIFINGYVTYLNQRKSYNEQCLENLDQISKHFTDRIISRVASSFPPIPITLPPSAARVRVFSSTAVRLPLRPARNPATRKDPTASAAAIPPSRSTEER